MESWMVQSLLVQVIRQVTEMFRNLRLNVTWKLVFQRLQVWNNIKNQYDKRGNKQIELSVLVGMEN